MGRSKQRAKERAAAAARRKAATKKNPLADFREDAGDNRALQVTNGASAVDLVRSGGGSGLSNILPAEGQAIINDEPLNPDYGKKHDHSPTTSLLKTGKIRERNKKTLDPKILRYPREMLDIAMDYLQISVVQYKPLGTNLRRRNLNALETSRRNSTSNKELIRTIILPIPSNVQDGNTVDYDSSRMGSIAAAAVASAEGVMKAAQAEKPLEEIVGRIKDQNLINSAGGVNSIVDLVTKQLASSAVNIFGANVTVDQLLARESGVIFNPNMELLFSGPTLRSFKFQFKMTPRNFDEGQDIKRIIREFKRSMAPKITTTGTSDNSTNSLFLSTPDVFELTYRKGGSDHPYLNRFKQCALLDISVNYTGEGTYATYDDGTPVSMIMDLTFRELEPVYDSDYYNSLGEDLDSTVGY